MKRIVLYFSFISLVAQPYLHASSAAPMPQIDQAALEQELANMSEEDLLKWQEKVTSEIFDMVETWDPKDQEAFYKEYERLSNMSEDELAQEIEKVFSGLEQAPAPAPEEEEQPVIEEQEEIKIEEKKPEEKIPTEDTDKALKLLSNLVTRTERFLRKSQSIPELAGKIEAWAPKDKIKEWPADLTWTKLKNDIEKFDQLLVTIKTGLDPKTKNPRYLSALLKDESLFNNLSRLSSMLTAHEPKVEVPLNDLTKVSKESREAIKEILGAFAESLYTLELMQAMQKIVASFEPRAEELRKEEEGHTKKATEASKYPRRESPRQEAGTGKSRYAQEGGNFDYSAYYGTPSGGYYGGYNGGGYAGGEAAYPEAPDYSAPAAGGAERGAGGQAGSALDKEGKEGKEGKEKEAGGAKEEKKDGKEKTDKKEAEADDSDVKDQLKNIRSHLEKAVDSFESNDQLMDLANHVVSKDPVDKEVVKGLSDLNRSLKKANGNIKAFKLGLTKLNTAQKDKYTKQMKSTIEQRYDSLEEVANQIQEAIKKEGSVPAAKKTAYFGEKKKEQDGEAKQSANIKNISAELDKYFTQTVDFAGKQPAMKIKRSKKETQ